MDKYGIRISAKEINERWPALLIPEYLEGIYTFEAGVIRVNEALNAFKELSEKQGTDLRYDTPVVSIDHDNGIVTTDDG